MGHFGKDGPHSLKQLSGRAAGLFLFTIFFLFFCFV